MVDRLIVDISSEGVVDIAVHWANETAPQRIGEPTTLELPLDTSDLEDLRWYLEDYLRWPFGRYADQGQEVARRMTEWGTALFETLFWSGPWREAYGVLRTRPAPVEVVVQSTSALHLGLPWELLHDPSRGRPLVLDGVGVVRSLPTNPLEPAFPLEQKDLRVLMVISRPAGDRDVGYRLIARPLLERLEAVRGRVDLVLLRPPTLDRLNEVLAEAVREGRPFQIVHFDGHGAFGAAPVPAAGADQGRDRRVFQGDAPQGMLAFERPGGGTDLVPAEKVARVLAEGQVPVVVLNACQSGQLEAEAEAAIATRLVQDRVASVIAMAYSVYTYAAAEFMAAFYERLFAGDRIAEAVTAGRRRLALKDTRTSPRGDLPLKDWVVPVHYRRSDISLPGLRTERTGMDPIGEILDRHRTATADASRTDESELASDGVFVGRDSLFHALESALPHQRVVVLHGAAGSGKTELAKAFGRWWRDTRGVDRLDLVFWHSFRPGGPASFSLDGVIGRIGAQVFGAEFTTLDPEQREAVVRELLATQRCLMIWDNFESTHTLPDPGTATPPLDATERDRINGFLDHVARGRSALIVTSRTREDWLVGVRRVPVGGLTLEEANEYTDQLLAGRPETLPKRQGEAFADLLRWLDGHPMSMKLILPLLESADPEALLEGLRGTTPLPDRDGADRDTSLSVSITYSFTHLAPEDQQALTVLSLFHITADINVLGVPSEDQGVPAQFQGLNRDDWKRVLDRAAGVGLLTCLGAGMYRMHPALPSYLSGLWSVTHPGDFAAQREVTVHALSAAFAAIAPWLSEQFEAGDASMALAMTTAHQANLGHILGHALEHDQWENALTILRVLEKYWDSQGLGTEAQAWSDRARLAVESDDGSPPHLNSGAGSLWLFVSASEAKRQLLSHRLDLAQAIYADMLDALRSQPVGGEKRSYLAFAYHQLGVVAQERGDLGGAGDWFRQSLAIEEELGNRRGMASSYHQLGMIAQEQGDLDAAEDWCRQSLAIAGELGDRRGMASSCHQLGVVAQERGDLDGAGDWHSRSLAIEEDLGNRRGMASSYHQLGMIAQGSGDFVGAKDWNIRSLTIHQENGDYPGVASSFHQLGVVAQKSGDLDGAADWYRHSLAVNEELDDHPRMALNYAQWGFLEIERGMVYQALERVVRSVTLFSEFPHPLTGAAPALLRLLGSTLGLPALEQTWLEVTGEPLPANVREFVESSE